MTDLALLISAVVAIGAALWTVFVMWPFIRLSRAELLAGRESRRKLDTLVERGNAYLAFYDNFKTQMMGDDHARRS